MKTIFRTLKTNTFFLFVLTLLAVLITSCYGGDIPVIEITVSTVEEGNFFDGLEPDSKGNIYGSDFRGDSVFKLDKSGNVTVFVSGLNSPNGIGVNNNDEVYVCDNFGNAIFKYDQEGNQLESFVAVSPAGIKKIPGSNDMLFVEYNTNTINRLSEDGIITKLFEGAPVNGPAGIAFDRRGNTYIGNFNDRKILKYKDGEVTEIAELPAGAENTNFLGFLTYAKGFLFATQLGEHKIYKINPNKVNDFEVFAGSILGNNDGDLSEATFNFPNGIVASRDQKTLYVSDAGTNNLRIISKELKY
ncbi:SMP-30/gluconolactonase/LRE family protein [Aquimarina sp. MMG016]|uniref:Vgb family protein n=1 Tax=Aquimarina sp. MMG016 TaxID=2822690 RepID=UPI001B39E3F5|nr:SMP-30/gluconolactonase/LRE family protein [Aquimarina sp. MMG016]MBQ4818955.1 SMP-30/gluconolactonase/LRE family protein [Aquimarina sp. MMG016]